MHTSKTLAVLALLGAVVVSGKQTQVKKMVQTGASTYNEDSCLTQENSPSSNHEYTVQSSSPYSQYKLQQTVQQAQQQVQSQLSNQQQTQKYLTTQVHQWTEKDGNSQEEQSTLQSKIQQIQQQDDDDTWEDIVSDSQKFETYVNTVVSEVTQNKNDPHCKISFTPEPTNLAPSYVDIYNTWYEEPTVEIYFYDETSQNYFVVNEPEPDQQYFYWSQDQQHFTPYEPTPVVWEEYYQTPTVDLFYYDEPTQIYWGVPEPSPYISYYQWSESTNEYIPYEPIPLSWEEYYAPPTIDLYYYDQSTSSFVIDKEPSPVVDYYQWSEQSQSYIPFVPEPLFLIDYVVEPYIKSITVNKGGEVTIQEESVSESVWEDLYEVPSVDLYQYNPVSESFEVVDEPSPVLDYYQWSEETQSYIPFVPEPLFLIDYDVQPYIKSITVNKGEASVHEDSVSEPVWRDLYELPTVDLYSYNANTETFEIVEEPSPIVDYVYWEPTLSNYIWYEPVSINKQEDQISIDQSQDSSQCEVLQGPEFEYSQKWESLYEPPVVDLYYYDEPTQQYFYQESPIPQISYYYWHEPSEEFIEYEPTKVQWTEYYQQPAETLYWQEPGTLEYILVEEPSPYVKYSTYDEKTETFDTYIPKLVSWEEYFEQPVVDLYWYDEATETYNLDKEPSPFIDYFYYNDGAENFVEYVPTESTWSDYYEEPSVELYTWDEPSQKYVIELEPSPYVTYQQWSEKTKKFIDYEPTVVEWSSFYVNPSIDLYWYDQSTGNYIIEDEEPSPYVQYYYFQTQEKDFIPYIPAPLEQCQA